MTEPKEGRRRVVVDNVRPRVDDGMFPVKRSVGDLVEVEADVFADGHDRLGAVLRFGGAGGREHEARMTPLGNDRWRAAFRVTELGRWCFSVIGWVDRFATWHEALLKRHAAGQDVSLELRVGADLLREAARRAASEGDADRLRALADRLRGARPAEVAELVTSEELAALAEAYPSRRRETVSARYDVEVARERARHGAWYELFPRSSAAAEGRQGTLGDVATVVPSIAEMGFDVVYLPPIHPIGRTNRKGRNNSERSAPDDPGSPWAIGAEEGGHTAVHPDLGTLEDVRRLIETLNAHAMELALDLAFQCAPDHPWVREHPEWFRTGPDGTIRYAENPPKRYEDIYPLDFETPAWKELWHALRDVVVFWVDRGVRIFRVDNPHTKPFAFWEWLIADVKQHNPDVLFLAEAFTRPRVMERLAKIGFDQSYTYFTWRTSARELRDYFTELTTGPVREYMRPNLWPNTPDILTEQLQTGGPPAFRMRFVLAATLGANYGIYGPAFEHMERVPREEGSEEYRDSEKYQLRWRDPRGGSAMRELITLVNGIRRREPALTYDHTLSFHDTDNDQLLAYSKRAPDGSNVVLTVVNLDPRHPQSGFTDLTMSELGLAGDAPFVARDLLTGEAYEWRGPRNYVELHPGRVSAHILRIESPVRAASEGVA
jgi:starch synthase (maltosyl-transferring)